MSSNLRAALTLTLKDELSSGLDRIKTEFEALKKLGGGLTLGRLEQGGSVLRQVASEAQNLTSSLMRTEGVVDRVWTKLKRVGGTALGPMSRVGAFGAAAEGYSVAAPIRAYAGFENTLRHIAITEKLSGALVEKEVARLTRNLGHEALATGQNSGELSKAYQFLITTGMSPALVDQLMPSHARAATAYNISSESMGQAVFALHDSFKIGHEDMGSALSAMAYAAKEAHFTVENFSQFLPAIGGRMQLLGMTGRGAANTAFAALETVVKNSSMPSQAATNFQDLMQYMTAPIATHSFAKMSIDLPKMLIEAEKKGVSPLDAFMGKLDALTAGKSPVQKAEIVGKLIHNQEAASAALSLLQHKEEFLRMRKLLGDVNADTLETDFQTAMRADQVQVRSFGEELEQLERRVGKGFAPILRVVNSGLDWMRAGVEWLDTKLPGVGDGVLLTAGALLSFGASVAAVGFVGPVLAKGWAMVSPILQGLWWGMRMAGEGVLWGMRTVAAGVWWGARMVAAGVGWIGAGVAAAATLAVAAGIDIYENWDRFGPLFRQMGDGLGLVGDGLVDVGAGFATLDGGRVVTGMNKIATGINMSLGGAVQTAIGLVQDLGNGLNGLSGGVLFDVFNALNNKLLELGQKLLGDPEANRKNFEKYNKEHPDTMPDRGDYGTGNPMGDQGGSGDAGNVGGRGTLEIRVIADPGTAVTGIRLNAAGRVLGRI